jgi:cytochrome c-type biogenesis protein CcmH
MIAARLLVGCCAMLALSACVGTIADAAARPSLPVIERQVMCVTCKIPLNVAESPQADRERAFIREMIDQGDDEAAIKHALVGQYGSTVLALPSDKGFDATAYIVPLVACLALLGLLLLLLPRWRRRARAQARAREPAPTLSAAEAHRLDADLERFD